MLNNVHFKSKFWFKIEKMGLFLVKKVVNKRVPISSSNSYFKPMPISEGMPNFLKNWESTKFDMGFQKKKHFKSIWSIENLSFIC
jgi:hypothetical protein